MKAAIIVLSDPKPGSEEALGRLFNGLAAAYDFKSKGDDVTIRLHRETRDDPRKPPLPRANQRRREIPNSNLSSQRRGDGELSTDGRHPHGGEVDLLRR